MSIGAYAPAMSAIDPNTGQLIELAVDQSGAYVMQDGSTVLTTSQLQPTIQGGKSLLKPELAQHLTQHSGYKAPVGRGGFNLGTNDPRWVNVSTPRTTRGVTRKPVGPTVGHLQPAALAIPQPTALAPAASGLLSLGTRYTPSSASAFGANASVPAGGAIVPSSGAATGLMSANVNNMGLERDPNYRLAAAIAGTGGRGRPRGRRPLRGQFPVVPIDMVRQLGIEQQVILQPAAPVAMRNKAVLCRPLSMCRKIQATPVQFDQSAEDSAALIRASDVNDTLLRKQQRKPDAQPIKIEASCQYADASVCTDLATDKTQKRRKTLDSGTCTLPSVSSIHVGLQTDESGLKEAHERIQYLPIPIPVPVLVPTPICWFSHPVPLLVPFPMPCVIPLPVLAGKPDAVDILETESPLCVDDTTNELPTELDRPQSPLLEVDAQLEEKSTESDMSESECETPNEVAETETTRIVEKVTVHPTERGLKRAASSPEREEEPDGSEPISEIQNEDPSLLHASPSLELTRENVPTTLVAEPVAPPAKRPRHTVVVSDVNYHLKFSYGINAWRHWVQQKLNSSGGVSSTQQYPYLKTELLNMSEADLNTTLSQFVREVRKPNNECYVADSIFYLCLGIQEYLNENGCTTNLFGGPMFADFTKALDDILANFQPRISPEGLLICRIEEEHLWEARQLGSHSPEILLFTVLYLNTKHFGLRVGTIHRQLAFAYFRFTEERSNNAALLCHLPGHLFGGGGEASTTLRLDVNEDCPARCPVALFRSYFSHCPPQVRNSDDMFYLIPSYRLGQSEYWFSDTAMESDELQVILNRIKMVKEIQEAFMNGQPDGGF